MKIAKVDDEDWLYDENENALIDAWQANPVLYDVTGYGVIIIELLKLKKVCQFYQFVIGLNDHVLVSCCNINIMLI